MKKNYLTLLIAGVFAALSFSIVSCGDSHESDATETSSSEGVTSEDDYSDDGEQHASLYACPMQCEGDVTHAEAGVCSVCGMDLEEVSDHDHEEGEDHEGHDHEDEEDHEGHEHEEGDDHEH